MDKIIDNFLNGEEIKQVKDFVKQRTLTETVIAIFVFLMALQLVTKLTIIVTTFGVLSLFVTHLLRKFSKPV